MSAAPTRYGSGAIGLHWLMALLVATGFGMALVMTGMSLSPTKLRVYSWHKWIGVTVFGLLWLRLGWRLLHAPPAPVPMPAWQRRSAAAVHAGLYVLLAAIPLTGWLYSSAAGFPTVYLGLVQLPDLVPKDAQLKAVLHEVHETLAWTLAALLAAHVAAALKHHLVDRDETLFRMLPLVGRPRPRAAEALR